MDESIKRKSLRVPITLKIEYSSMNNFIAEYIENISKGGLFIASESPLAVGTEFEFTLLIPRVLEPITLQGKVRWIRTSEEGDHVKRSPGMGISFIYENEAARVQFEDRIEKLIIDYLGYPLYTRLMTGSK